jgi:ubiquitin thioesterase OTU1
MAPLRLRHPNGITTIDLDWEIATVNDLQQQIRGATDIFPSQQDCGYYAV